MSSEPHELIETGDIRTYARNKHGQHLSADKKLSVHVDSKPAQVLPSVKTTREP